MTHNNYRIICTQTPFFYDFSITDIRVKIDEQAVPQKRWGNTCPRLNSTFMPRMMHEFTNHLYTI